MLMLTPDVASAFCSIDARRIGIVVMGDVGVASHVGDLLRQSGIVSYIDPTGIV
jgi:hypothetical protein